MDSWKSRGNQFVQLVKVLLTSGDKYWLSDLRFSWDSNFNLIGGRQVLPLHHHSPQKYCYHYESMLHKSSVVYLHVFIRLA